MRAFDLFVAIGSHSAHGNQPVGRGYLALPKRGLAAVADALYAKDPELPRRCANLALSALELRDAVARGADLRPRPQVDSAQTLLASFEAANDLIHRAIDPARPHSGATTSLAAVLLDGPNAFVAWAGHRVRVHRLAKGSFSLITPTMAATPEAGGDPQRTGTLVRIGDQLQVFGGDLGDAPTPTIHHQTVSLAPGDLLFLSGGWRYEPPESEQAGRDMLRFIASPDHRMDRVLAECLRQEPWAPHLPGIFLRANA